MERKTTQEPDVEIVEDRQPKKRKIEIEDLLKPMENPNLHKRGSKELKEVLSTIKEVIDNYG